MVRELTFEVDFPHCTPREFYDVIFSDDTSTKIYHKLNSSKDGATVSDWENNERTVHFSKDLQLPRAIAAIIGCSSIPIMEVQTIEWNGIDTFTISSAPTFQLTIGPSLSGSTSMTVSPKDSASSLEIHIRCGASGPWGVSNLIENFMIREAEEGVQNFLTFCETRIAESMMEADSGIEAESDLPVFYDVLYETLSQFSNSDRPGIESSMMLTPDAIIMNHLTRIEEEIQTSRQTMEKMRARLEALEMSLEKNRYLMVYALLGCCSVGSAVLVASTMILRNARD